MRWLAVNSIEFPSSVDGGVGNDQFYGWRFIEATDGVVYFADCIHAGITKEDARSVDDAVEQVA